MKKTLCIAIASLFGLASCAGTDDRGMRVRCDVGPFTVGLAGGKIVTVSQDPIPVLSKNQWICWELDRTAAADYKFVDDSIYIEDRDDEFSNCKGSNRKGDLQGDTRIACHDKNNKHGESNVRYYKYTIKLEPRSSAKAGGTKSYDPMIGND
jgi:hypothetical protein